MAVLNMVTAVSRPQNLMRIFRSIRSTIRECTLPVKWIMVFDSPNNTPEDFQKIIDKVTFMKIQKAYWPNGPMKFGIPQKNLGMDLCEEGFFHLLDDDNLVHPNFLKRISQLVKAHPDKLAFAFNQRRWDQVNDLRARPESMYPGQIDNTMFVVHTSLIGSRRYDFKHAGYEDGMFFMELFRSAPEAFVFVDEFLAYYNFLRR